MEKSNRANLYAKSRTVDISFLELKRVIDGIVMVRMSVQIIRGIIVMVCHFKRMIEKRYVGASNSNFFTPKSNMYLYLDNT